MTDIWWYIQHDRYLHADIFNVNAFMKKSKIQLWICFVQNIKL